VQASLAEAPAITDDLLGFVGYLLKDAQGEVLEVAAALDLSLSQLRALHVLDAAQRPLALHELAGRMGLSVAATGRAVDVLVRGGLVSRREDESDRRVKRIAIADAGREAVNRLIAARREGMARFAATLSGEERAALSRALTPILARPELQAVCKGVSR
jgi:DNA-binding MarR family transcriptional regulator